MEVKGLIPRVQISLTIDEKKEFLKSSSFGYGITDGFDTFLLRYVGYY